VSRDSADDLIVINRGYRPKTFAGQKAIDPGFA
jgi:hypothetical protein